MLSPKRGAGAGVAVGMCRGGGIPLVENKMCLGYWFLGFKVSRFLGFKVSWLLRFVFVWGFLATWLQSFKVSTIQRFEIEVFKVSKFQSCSDPILPTFHFMFSGRY